MAITFQQATCCLITAVVASAAEAGAPGYEHQFPSVANRPPYCPHDAVTATYLGRTTEPPPGELPADDGSDRVWYWRFEVKSHRAQPAPHPDKPSECLAGLYGDCASPADATTIAGHHAVVMAEVERLERELLNRWCECLQAIPGGGYSASRPRWFVAGDVTSEGRFTTARFEVNALIL